MCEFLFKKEKHNTYVLSYKNYMKIFVSLLTAHSKNIVIKHIKVISNQYN